MRNYWIARDVPVAAWTADLTPVHDDHEALAAWLEAVVTAGERHRVYEVHTAPLVPYRAATDGPLPGHLRALWEREGVLDLFHFAAPDAVPSGGEWLDATGRVAFYDAAGELVEEDVADLGLVLKELMPRAWEESPIGFSWAPPLALRGPRIDTRDPAGSWWPSRPGRVQVRFETRSDIWFPWVIGLLADEPTGPDRRFDNRKLATRHTPRLNTFLAEARAATLQAGGVWALDEEELRPALPGMVGELGIDLDVAPS